MRNQSTQTLVSLLLPHTEQSQKNRRAAAKAGGAYFRDFTKPNLQGLMEAKEEPSVRPSVGRVV